MNIKNFLYALNPHKVKSLFRMMRALSAEKKQGNDPDFFFDKDFYLQTYAGIKSYDFAPAAHYALFGWEEGRNPSPYFDTEYYLNTNPDVRRAGSNPLVHYMEYGWKEGRTPHPEIHLGKGYDTMLKNSPGDRNPLPIYISRRFSPDFMDKNVPPIPYPNITELIFTHPWGGGTEVYVRNNLLSGKSEDQITAIAKQLSSPIPYIQLEVQKGDSVVWTAEYDETEHFIYALSKTNIQKITVNNLVAWSSTAKILSAVSAFKRTNPSLFVEVKGHDFYPVCPSYTLLDAQGKFCNVRSDEVACEECIASRNNALVFCDEDVSRGFSVTAWRKMWGDFFKETADVLEVFSPSSMEIFEKAFPMCKGKMRLHPHNIPAFRMCRVAVIGHLNIQKGSYVIDRLVKYLEEHQINDMQVFLFGGNPTGIKSRYLSEMGEYMRGELPELLRRERIDLVFIPSIWPETFCYTVGEALSLGYPVACFDFGGQADQVRNSSSGVILSHNSPDYLYSVFSQFARNTGKEAERCDAMTAVSPKEERIVIQDRSSSDFLRYLFAMRDDKSCFVPEAEASISLKEGMPRVIAFYLPQFHDFPENVKWFGRGFTEWTNTSRTLPQFIGHNQPQIPIDVGYYNLSTTAPMHRQAELAKKYGISGFSVYYYWFSGQKLMEQPMRRLLEDKTLDFPFFFFWANENWTRLWGDGEDRETLYKAELLPGDDTRFMDDILPYMADSRYIKIHNRPVLIIYKLKTFPKDAFLHFNRRIREIARENGFDGLYISGIIEDWMDTDALEDIQKEYCLDAITEFSSTFGRRELSVMPQRFADPNCRSVCYDVAAYIRNRQFVRETKANLFAGLFTNWDNSPRRYSRGGSILQNTPEDYKLWLSELIKWTMTNHKDKEERLIFVNAWNEWAECAHLEPDTHYGYAYLQKTREALEEYQGESSL